MIKSRRIVAMGIGIAVLAGLDACNQQWAEPARELPSPARHAVRSRQLRRLMDRINSNMATNWPQEMEPLQRHRARAEDFRRAARIADLLADSAEKIPEAVADVSLSKAERADFLAIVDQLHKEADDLSTAAAAHDRNRMQATISRIRTTCYGCHAQFGRYTGPLPKGEASP